MHPRNPFLLPEVAPPKRCCPACGSEDFTGRNAGGILIFTCKVASCRTEFGGGLPRVGYRADEIRPHEAQPSLHFVHDPRTKDVKEVLRHPSTLQSYRTGALVPGEDDVG